MSTSKRQAWCATIAVALVASIVACAPVHAQPFPMRVLVTNDDGVGAEGISVLIEHLSEIRGMDIELIAPATNQSGTGSNYSTTPIDVFPASTAGGFGGLAVRGFPSDTVLFGFRSGEFPRPDLVVSGINAGQNIADAVTISGTVGAALTAAKMGVPAFAVSQALGTPLSYEDAAAYTTELVRRFRSSATFRRLLRTPRSGRGLVVNINFPTCEEGELRGVKAVAVGQSTQIVGYSENTPNVWTPTIERQPLGSTDCDSTLLRPLTDIEALNNGFASVTVLNPDLTNEDATSSLRRYFER
jgi:5'-nucleotidase